MRILVWGSYDTSKPRVRLLLEGLRSRGVIVGDVHADIWTGVRDKGTLSTRQVLGAGFRWLRALPWLAWKYVTAPAHDIVLVPYLGLFDVLVLAPFALWRRKPVYWDIFISGYDTVVNDRRLLRRRHPLALALYTLEWLASRFATRSFLDTRAHANRFEKLMHLSAGSIGAVPLGTDTTLFSSPAIPRRIHCPLRAFFYGQFIPLHGIETIVRAACILERDGVPVTWELAGVGQESDRTASLIASLQLHSVHLLGWLDASTLPAKLRAADVGLGIFGTSGKAMTVVPNKVFEMAATQTPLICGDSPAMREFAAAHPWIRLVHPGSPEALAETVRELATLPRWPDAPPMPTIGPTQVADAFLAMLPPTNVEALTSFQKV